MKGKEMATRKKKSGDRGTKEQPTPSIRDEIGNYICQLESLSFAFNSITPALSQSSLTTFKEMEKFVEARGIKIKKTRDVVSYTIEAGDLADFERHQRKLKQIANAFQSVPEAFFVALVCRYDAYLGRLLRMIFDKKPEIIEASKSTFTLCELISLKSVKAARLAVIEREVESVIRRSHVEHFCWMEKSFGVDLRKDLLCWPVFVELTERRNLLVHCDGVISTQYLANCRAHKVELSEEPRCGGRLRVDAQYFDASFNCLLELGVKLGQVLWRKLFPLELEEADVTLNNICFDLLVDAKYDLARLLLEFGVNNMKKHSSILNKQLLIINLAQSYKWAGNRERCSEVLDGHDWTGSSLDFQMAVAVLRDQFDAAARSMRQMGRGGRYGKTEYAGWPLFREFIKSPQFKRTYKAVFRKEFRVTEKSPASRNETGSAVKMTGRHQETDTHYGSHERRKLPPDTPSERLPL